MRNLCLASFCGKLKSCITQEHPFGFLDNLGEAMTAWFVDLGRFYGPHGFHYTTEGRQCCGLRLTQRGKLP